MLLKYFYIKYFIVLQQFVFFSQATTIRNIWDCSSTISHKLQQYQIYGTAAAQFLTSYNNTKYMGLQQHNFSQATTIPNIWDCSSTAISHKLQQYQIHGTTAAQFLTSYNNTKYMGLQQHNFSQATTIPNTWDCSSTISHKLQQYQIHGTAAAQFLTSYNNTKYMGLQQHNFSQATTIPNTWDYSSTISHKLQQYQIHGTAAAQFLTSYNNTKYMGLQQHNFSQATTIPNTWDCSSTISNVEYMSGPPYHVSYCLYML